MNQTEKCATKRVFGVIISYENVLGKRLLDFLASSTVFSLLTVLSYILIIVLLQLTVFSNRLEVYCTSMGSLTTIRNLKLSSFH